MQQPTLSLTFFTLPAFILLLSLLHMTAHPVGFKKMMIKLAFFTSLPPLILLTYNNMVPLSFTWHWLSMGTCPIYLSLKLDTFSIFFVPTALFVTWSIMEFTELYMDSDLKIISFFNHLLIFILMMIILVTANNLFQLFIGWEGVGIMSFKLINWWSFRANSNKAALQAITYNRLADVGMLAAMSWMILNNISLDIQDMPVSTNHSLIPAIGLVLAATGKSAQFGFHPWLPAAMEGPTPVSALLHSSTMVVAGIFLLIRTSHVVYSSQAATTACLLLGAITSLFAASCALTQNDMKKIIAFSTSSQLGLMMATIGLKQPELAFLHISTHAFFKAMLFLCAGSIIHNLNNEQDIRKMGGLKKAMPITTSCLTIGALALTGMPFLSGFFSKDAIIEALNTSYINACALTLVLLATSFTAVYSLRMIYFTLLNPNRLTTTNPINENPKIVNPILRLAAGSIMAGLLISSSMLPSNTPQLTMSNTAKLAALIITMIGLLIAATLTHATNKFPPITNDTQPPFLTKLTYFNHLFHHFFPTTTLRMSQKLSTHLADQTWYEALGPKMMTHLQTLMAKILTPYHKGKMKQYFKIFMLTIIMIIFFTSFMSP
ncbi:NADH dehydrogenase subunit 5 (mitochondrion) [Alligator mississippiensis]|uniref:NADH-ubiquinone oxidoreductase chain 5 n=1 Tax=Alligator mississippiensis TaxID=8496 RepID=Q33790_ALLMI|nr:NADH dehydrogenase subunit 5 [Alligator mississippiensis]CAA73571.1 NADH dehydrogenase subunit 5 [Alligator mississippiensis]